MNRLDIVMAATLVATAHASLSAQSNSQDRNNWLRNNCRLAVQVIATGEPAPKKAWAYGFIQECPEAGDALASAWNRALSGDDLFDRQRLSARTLDSRILNTAATVASDASRAVEERWSALVVITALYAPGQSVHSLRWDKEPGLGTLGGLADGGQSLGSSPITAADRARALAAVQQIAATDGGPLNAKRVVTRLAVLLADVAP